MPGAAEAVTGELDPRGGPRPPRRGDPRPRRLRPAALAGGTRDRALPRRGPARRRAAGASSATTTLVAKRGRRRRDRQRPPRCRRSRGSTRSRPGTTATRRPRSGFRASMIVLGGGAGRLRARPGLVGAGDGGHPGRGRRADPAARGALRQRAGRRRPCATGTASTSAPAPTPSGSARAAAGVEVELDGGERLEAAELLVAVGRKPRTAGIGLDSVGVEPGERRLPRDRRADAGRRQRLALRGRRRQRPGALHPHGQVPGLDRRRERPRPRGRGDRRRARPAPGHLHRPAGRRGRHDPRAGRRRPGSTRRAVDVATDGTAGASFYGKDTGGTTRLVVDRGRRTIVGATFTGFETADFLHAATIAIVGEVPARPPAPRRRRLPHPQRDLAQAAGGVRSQADERSDGRAAFRSSRTSCGNPGTCRGRRPSRSGRAARGGRAGASPG